MDADGKRTEFVHSTTNSLERVNDRLGNTNTFLYDPRGNVTATTNALGGVSLMAYDDENKKTNEVLGLSASNSIGQTNWDKFNTHGLLTNSIIGGLVTNSFQYDDYGNLTSGR